MRLRSNSVPVIDLMMLVKKLNFFAFGLFLYPSTLVVLLIRAMFDYLI